MDQLLHALAPALSPLNLLLVVGGTTAGIVIGAIPGLTATMAIALLVPFTFGYSILPATALLLGIYCGGMYGGAISAVLLRVPGAPSNAPTTFDGYPMTLRGESGRAIAVSTISSFIGGLVSTIILIVSLSSLTPVVLMFGVEEYFVMTVFGVVIVIALSGGSMNRGFISALLGILVGMVGLDRIMPYPRFTFGITELLVGFPQVPALIGLFCLSQGFRMLEERPQQATGSITVSAQSISFQELWGIRRTLLRSSIIGTIVGIIPAAGPNIASFLGYSEARRASATPEKFGTGIIEGVAAPEAANNAVPAGALLPLLSFGIPGDTVTAILLGALMLHGYAPGPMMIRENTDLLYPMFVFLIVANFTLLAVGLLAIRPIASMLRYTSNRRLVGVVLLFSIVGGFAYSGQISEALITVAFGILGYLLEKIGISIVPMAITIILGPMMEVYLRQSLIANEGSIMPLFTRPIALALWILAILMAWATLRVNRRIAIAEAAATQRLGLSKV
ncbi:MAG: tripartite tricarboxylate transporter permease [Hyphomicrobiaceae bacterium]